MNLDLQDVNFRNLVSFHNAELVAIQSGKKAAEVLSERERQKLKDGSSLSESRIYSGQILVLGLVQLIETMAIALPLSYFPNYVVGLGASVASVGVFTSSFMIAFAVLSPRMGGFVDKYGRKRVMMLGVASDVVLGTLTGLVPSWEWLLLIRLVNGAVSSGAMLASRPSS